jgi:acyl-CoA thioesterase-1
MASMPGEYGGSPERRNPSIAAMLLFALLAFAVSVGEAPASPPIRLLVLGDSLSAGYGLPHEEGFEAQLQAALRVRGQDIQIIDGAVSGDTTAGGRARLDWVLAEGADAAIVELGANDGLRGLDPSEMQANLTAILDTLAAKQIPVLLSGMYAPPNLGPDYGRAFRAVFERLGRRPGVIYDPFFLEGVATVPSLNQPDGLHPNAEGVRHIVKRLLPEVERLLTLAADKEASGR